MFYSPNYAKDLHMCFHILLTLNIPNIILQQSCKKFIQVAPISPNGPGVNEKKLIMGIIQKWKEKKKIHFHQISLFLLFQPQFS